MPVSLKATTEESSFGTEVKFTCSRGFVGFCLITTTDSKDRLSCFSVSKKFRGKGLASIILQQVLDMCQSNVVSVEVYEDNEVALNLYSKFGFECNGKSSNGLVEMSLTKCVL